ncbi:flagellar hook-basal body complex protein [Donghicola sp. C2-DW-16]|uniref:Flagellar hook-basal body complex protein n=1 Tax=Donghicola mangrovi TaxID=2729614 RepID=A0ABX2PA41_9RHOB|nr:flagellar hook-basal body complex protein [Donghicola mangrovi]NVO25966.1 flagellar hook-basal body complex protein [Donghicola mangrovi]
MDASSLAPLSRQRGLIQEMSVIAQNIANAQTTGYREQGVLFSEYLAPDAADGGLSMTRAHGRLVSNAQGALFETGGQFDLAIDGKGYFQVDDNGQPLLTRAGHFVPDAFGTLRSPDGYALMDLGGTPVQVPPDAREIAIAPDGTLSADGQPLARIGVVSPENPGNLSRSAGAVFVAPDGALPTTDGALRQGYLEESNVDPIRQMARMVEVQRAYEMGQSFLRSEDERMRTAIDTLTR